jgi:hypothetical protein
MPAPEPRLSAFCGVFGRFRAVFGHFPAVFGRKNAENRVFRPGIRVFRVVLPRNRIEKGLSPPRKKAVRRWEIRRFRENAALDSRNFGGPGLRFFFGF